MIGVSIRHLRYFNALAEHGHFGRAAQACAISQPALSVQISEFEAILGGALVERGTRHARLTGLGEAVAGRTRAILQAVDELGDLARLARGPLSGSLRFGLIPTIAPYMLPVLIRTLGEHWSSVELQPRETTTQNLIGDLQGGRLDAAIVALPVAVPGLSEFRLFDEEFVLVRHRTAAGTPVPNAEALRSQRLLLLEEGHCFRDQALSFCGLTVADPRAVMEATSLSTVVQMVSAGIGVTLIPEMAVSKETGTADVIIDRLPAPPPIRTIGMVWRTTNPLAEQFRHLGETLQSAWMATRCIEAPVTMPG